MAESDRLTHVDGSGQARMVDVSGKPRVRRTARAEGFVFLAPGTVRLVRENALAKGDVLAAARLAGILAAKRTSDLIPLCHNIEIEHVEVRLEVLDDRIRIEASAACTDKTGIEMEALTAVSVAALTVYDMCKAVDKGMRIEGVRLLEKTKEAL
ncbi:MAG TPA: cyclic pyranopterin monophosphate synthase MoaC [Spirochaetia bacterium]|nr:cyclic pyranopterin monophosphate synthase MoaC [Spirochaetales bacterium]HRY81461.1 cyclic pyranopterin monophosphate synthase MoaC [Spirochaetia bacterium]